MSAHPWYVPSGSTADGSGASVVIDPTGAGWTYCGLEVRSIDAVGHELATDEREFAVLPLSGAVVVEVERPPLRAGRT